MERTKEMAKSLETVTHTHTHTHRVLKDEVVTNNFLWNIRRYSF